MMFENLKEDYQIHGRSLKEPGLWAMATYRFGRYSMGLSSRPARWVTGKVYGLLYVLTGIVTGVYIPREVTIGRRFHLVHAEGPISIHPQTIIGDDVGIMHSVTIGANMSTGAPVIEDKVFIGVGAVVLGNVTVGRGARIGANSLVMSNIPPGAVAIGVPARILPDIAGKEAKQAASASRGEANTS